MFFGGGALIGGDQGHPLAVNNVSSGISNSSQKKKKKKKNHSHFFYSLQLPQIFSFLFQGLNVNLLSYCFFSFFIRCCFL